MRYSIVSLCWLLMSTGCINLDAPPDPTRYFIMNGPEAAGSEAGFAVRVELVTLEPYLASPRIVVRLDDNEVRFSDINRWAEPLSDNIRSTLAANLAVSPIGTLSNRPATEARLVVRVHVHRFEGHLPDRARLEATWSVENATGHTLVRRRSEHVVSGWGGTDYEQLTRLLESTVSLLAREIAESV